MANTTLPQTMRIWKYASSSGGIENHLRLLPSEPLPKPKPTEHLIRVLAVGLNPVDYKPFESPLAARFLLRNPVTPGFDVVGRMVTPASTSSLKPGTIIYGCASTSPLAGGALAEYVAAPAGNTAVLPSSVSPLHAAGAPVAAATALGSLEPYIKQGSRVFLNGGSGGVGTYAIQIAKLLGARVTVSCSGANAGLCRELGADDVVDYKAGPLVEQLKTREKFDVVVDNVFTPELYWSAHEYTVAGAPFVEVASGPSLAFVKFALSALLRPSWLGGGKRKMVLFASDNRAEILERIAKWMEEGKLKPVTDEVFRMEDVVAAYKKLKTGRTRGKIVIDVAGEEQ